MERFLLLSNIVPKIFSLSATNNTLKSNVEIESNFTNQFTFFFLLCNNPRNEFI